MKTPPIYFIEGILPAIQLKCPNVKFYVVGQFPTERLKRYGNRPGVVVTGRVDDVKPYIACATVYVVPLRIGGGTRLKILEALAMGKAVVSTSVGAEGLNLTADDEIMIADEPAAFADGVLQLMQDGSTRRILGENGRRRRRIRIRLAAYRGKIAGHVRGSGSRRYRDDKHKLDSLWYIPKIVAQTVQFARQETQSKWKTA